MASSALRRAIIFTASSPVVCYRARMNSRRIVIAGGGAAGFFAALACAEAGYAGELVVLEKGPQFLAKVKISGGGRCNVTHACSNERDFATRFPRGDRALIAPFK